MSYNFDKMLNYDTIIIGGGIIGTAIAKNLLQKSSNLKIALLEKEKYVGQHQSSHNSQVIHSGIYYKPNSLKAKLCREGADLIYKYCKEKKISFKKNGKLILASDCLDRIQMKVLYQQGQKNKVPNLKLLRNWKDVLEIQPNCKGVQALWSPNTGNVNFGIITKHFAKDFVAAGGEIFCQTKASKIRHSCESLYPLLVEVEANNRTFLSKYVILCTGFYSSDILFENWNRENRKFKNISFKVTYSSLNPKLNDFIKTNIYALPHTTLPFLGIHISPTVSGEVTMGPNAIPALKIDGYRSSDFDFTYLKNSVFSKNTQQMFLKNIPTCLQQASEYFFQNTSAAALAQYFPMISKYDLTPGLTAVQGQLITEDGEFVDDFIIEFFEGNDVGSRIINCRFIPSPGATSCISLAELVCDKLCPKIL